jgi:DNA-binding transcriptional LysR family regulator
MPAMPRAFFFANGRGLAPADTGNDAQHRPTPVQECADVPRRLNWDDLRFFLAVARSGTLSGAARRLAADHATVGRRVTGLEQALAVKLFERSVNGYSLTRHGERLLPIAQGMESEAERAQRDIASSEAGVSGTVRLSTLEGFGNFFLAPRLASFARRNPRLSIELVTIQQIVALSRREADVAITLSPPPSGRFVVERLTDYRLRIYGAAEYLALAHHVVTVDDLTRHPFVGYIDDLVFTRGLDYLDEVVPGLRARLQSSSLHAQLSLVAAGFGLAVLPDFIARHEPSLRCVLPDKVSLGRTYWMVSHSDVAESARVRALREFLHGEVAIAKDAFLAAPAT